MKKIILIIGVILMLAWGCDNHDDIQGQWLTSDYNQDLVDAISVSTIFTFTEDGRVTINSTVEIIDSVKDDCAEKACKVSMRALASIDGSWHYDANHEDKVIVTYDDQSFTLKIDPTSVLIDGQGCNDELCDSLIAENITDVTGDMRRFFAQFDQLNDIRVSSDATPLLQFDAQYYDEPGSTYTLEPM